VSANSTKCNTSAGGKLLEKADSNDNEIQKNKYITQSVKYLTKALEIYPKNLNALILLGNAKIKQKEYAASRNCYAACLAYNPKHNHALNNLLHLAQYTYDKDVYDESAKTYTLLLKYQPDIPENYFGLGLAYRGMQKYDSALSFLNHAQKLKPDYVEAISKMGEIYGQDLHNLDSSEAFFQKALTIKPDDESSLENLGIVFGIRRNYEKSLFYFRKALELEPDKHQLYMNIAETYRLMGDMKSYTEYKMKSEQIFNKKQ
ncbi:MAG: tetratricopeptide repeat protein, partial [Bacteroidales bacterium]